MLSPRKPVETYNIQWAIQALRAFCEKYGVELTESTVVAFAVAWATGKSFEWTPGGEHFCRIYAVRPRIDERDQNVAIVIDNKGYRGSYQGNAELTLELNDWIAQYTRGEFGVRRPAPVVEQPA